MDKTNISAKTENKFDFRQLLKGDGNIVRLLIMMIITFVTMSALKPGLFLTIDNFSSMAFQFPEFGVIAIAMMTAMLTGGIDLSIVGVANLSGILSALVMTKMLPENAAPGQMFLVVILAIAISLVTGLLCGLFNGIAIAQIGIPPILATLGSMQLFTGVAIIITKGSAVFGFPETFTKIGNGSLWIVPVPLILFIICAAAFTFLLDKTSFGFKLYMMGTNAKATKYSGIDNTKMLIKTYMLTGLLAAVAGLIVIARTNSAKADYGTSYTLQAVLIAVMGGVNPDGGFGKVKGIVLAVLILQFLSSGFNMMHFSNYFKDFVWGAVLIVIMVVNFYVNKRSVKKIS